MVQGTEYAPNSAVDVLFNGQPFTTANADGGGTFATEYFPETSQCRREIEVVANGQAADGAALSKRGSLTVTC